MNIQLPELPWKKSELSGFLSENLLDFHYDKHHIGYFNKLMDAIKGTENENKTLEEIITTSSGGLFNNAAQIYNHSFYWNSLTGNSTKKPKGELLTKIEKSFGSFDKFKEEFSSAAATNFGSGWTWLVDNNGTLEVLNTDDADTPSKHNRKPLLTLDIWEHAYYLDYQNKRPDYISKFWDFVNWDFVESNL